MAVQIQVRRGDDADFSDSLQLADGEIAIVKDQKKLVVGDGSTTYANLIADGKFIRYQTDQGLGVVGGQHDAATIPLTIQGATGQTAALLKIIDDSDNAILTVDDDGVAAVAIDTSASGDGTDPVLTVKGHGSQSVDFFQVLKGSAELLDIDSNGRTTLKATGANASSLRAVGVSDDPTAGIFRIEDSSNNLILMVTKTEVLVEEGDIRIDGGTLKVEVEDDTASNVTLDASSTDTDKVITVDGNGGTENFSVTAGGAIATNGAVTSEGKGTFADAEIDVTGRTLAVGSVMRRDEILADLQAFKLYEYNVTNTGGTLKIQKLTTTDGNPVSVVNSSNILSTAVVTSSASASDTDPDMLDTPGSSVFPAIKLVSGESLLLSLTQTAYRNSPSSATSQIQINSYTSDSLASGVKTTIRDETDTGDSPQPTSVVHAFTNTSGSDRFIAVASRGTSATLASPTLKGQVFISKMMPTLLSTAVGESSAFEITVLS
jgi:hypothetical protein